MPLPAKRANGLPVEQWPTGWLKLETASLLNVPKYVSMHDHEKAADGYPVTEAEMIHFIKSKRE